MYFSKLKYLIILISIIGLYIWWIEDINTPCVTVPEWYEPRVEDEIIKKAMRKMGPYYDYKMVGDKLYVNKGDGKWLKLNY